MGRLVDERAGEVLRRRARADEHQVLLFLEEAFGVGERRPFLAADRLPVILDQRLLGEDAYPARFHQLTRSFWDAALDVLHQLERLDDFALELLLLGEVAEAL